MIRDRAGDRLPAHERNDLLYEAASSGNTETVKLLLERGADPTALHTSRRTAVQSARENRHYEVAEILNAALRQRRQSDQR